MKLYAMQVYCGNLEDLSVKCFVSAKVVDHNHLYVVVEDKLDAAQVNEASSLIVHS